MSRRKDSSYTVSTGPARRWHNSPQPWPTSEDPLTRETASSSLTTSAPKELLRIWPRAKVCQCVSVSLGQPTRRCNARARTTHTHTHTHTHTECRSGRASEPPPHPLFPPHAARKTAGARTGLPAARNKTRRKIWGPHKNHQHYTLSSFCCRCGSVCFFAGRHADVDWPASLFMYLWSAVDFSLLFFFACSFLVSPRMEFSWISASEKFEHL